MRKWNLKFSGARGEDAETFLLRIEERRKLIPVDDEDVLRCLPFFLSGIALAESCCRAALGYRAPPPPELSLFPDLAYRPTKNGGRPGKLNETLAALDLSASGEGDNAARGKKSKDTRIAGKAGTAG